MRYSIAAFNKKTGQRLIMPVRSTASRTQLCMEVDAMNGYPSYAALYKGANPNFKYALTNEPLETPDLGYR